jgi:hydroxymethylpyrimidine pyrophosphatase-like HAD family hydrolase
MIDFVNKHKFSVGSWDEPDISFDKLCIWPEEDVRANQFHEKYKDILDFIDREGHLYEIVPKGYSKASGIAFMLNKLGIPYENTYAFGDGENDLPMLTYAKHSIAMGNAPQSIKDIVTHVTEDVDQAGIELALKHFKLI